MNESSKGRVLIFSGPSGVGKGTLLKKLFAETDFPLVSSVSATTRKPRSDEENGVHYWFLTREDFIARRERGEFLESFEVYAGGAWYGTLRQTVQNGVDSGKWVVLEIDVKGAEKIVEQIPDACTFFIAPPTVEDLRRRLIERGTESDEEIDRRVSQAQKEIDASSSYRFHIVNDELDEAFDQIVKILKKL